jgi:hypothetical protein
MKQDQNMYFAFGYRCIFSEQNLIQNPEIYQVLIKSSHEKYGRAFSSENWDLDSLSNSSISDTNT